MDLVMETDMLPKQGETIFGSGFSVVCGGKGANQAVAAAKLGAEVKMIGAVGDDVFSEKLISNLEKNGVGTEGIKVFEGSSGIAAITVCNGDNSIILEKGANAKVDCKLIDENIFLINWADVILFQFEIPLETIIYAAEMGKKFGKKIVVNPAPFRKFPDELFKYTDVIIPNEHEAAQMLGYEIMPQTQDEAVISLVKCGCEQVIITLGSKGCIYNCGNSVKNFGIYKTEVVDTTAAGDSFIAAFCIAHNEGKCVDEAISFATMVSAIVVSRVGAATSIPSRDEIEKYNLKFQSHPCNP